MLQTLELTFINRMVTKIHVSKIYLVVSILNAAVCNYDNQSFLIMSNVDIVQPLHTPRYKNCHIFKPISYKLLQVSPYIVQMFVFLLQTQSENGKL